jgi:hypothetical protein
MTCCDKPLQTPFCPFCGKPNMDPLLAMVTYFQGQAELNLKRAKSYDSPGRERTVETYSKKSLMFAEWAEHLLTLANKEIE